MLAKVPVHRGSLIKGIENLLKTIEISESAVMIPTLLRDKCQFDAWELLFVAKILKASILGHIDLVEFYMNHIGLNSSQFAQQQQAGNNGPSGAGTPAATPTNGNNTYPQPPSSTSASQDSHNVSPSPSTSSPTSSPASRTTSATTNGSPASWASATNGTQSNGTTASGDSLASGTADTKATSCELAQDNISGGDLLAPTVRPSVLHFNQARQAQAPSLLQLTTTNNHINSVAQQHQPAANFEQLTNQLNALQLASSPTGLQTAASSADSALSISTNYQHQQLQLQAAQAVQPPVTELRTSRSAGCLLRLNSGASSPRTPATPTTPFSPQAETLGLNSQAARLSGDPSAPVRLLLQIEQLKSSIGHVTSLLESVVELYKESIDSIA